LENIVAYVTDNHIKHVDRWGERLIATWDKGLGGNKGFKPLVQAACVPVEEACQPSGGFDAIIGNPPYIRIQTLQETSPAQVAHLKTHYRSASSGNYDIYVVFVEKGLSLLNERGRLGFILPHKFFNAKYGEALRGLIAEGQNLAEVIHFGDQQVFAGATTYTCLLFLDKTGVSSCRIEKVTNLTAWSNANLGLDKDKGLDKGLKPLVSTVGTIPAANVSAAEWNFTVGQGAALFERLRQMPVKLGDAAKRIFQGFKTGADPVFILEERATESTILMRWSQKFLSKQNTCDHYTNLVK
jgi:hypothetical protein